MASFVPSAQQQNTVKKATFAGGCFWCMVKPFDTMPGVLDVVVGYTGGHTAHPTYKEVCSEKTGHTEAVQITFDASRITYDTLLTLFWRQIDPTDAGGQFFDRGTSYRTAIFYHDDDQKQQALASKQALSDSGRFAQPIYTPIVAATPFYPAEEEHQKYYAKNPSHYEQYRRGSGRASYVQRMWEDA